MSRNQAQKGHNDTSSRLDEGSREQSTKHREHGETVTWKGGAGLAAAQPQVSTDEEGFKTVDRKKPTRPNDRTGRFPNINGAPSAAAVSREQAYDKKYSKAPSGHKESCSPANKRDPPPVRRTFHRDTFQPGVIVSGALHEPSFGGRSDATYADQHLTKSTYYGTIHSKERKFIVLASFQNHYLPMPMYTHNGRGLEGKSQPDEYVSVQDHQKTAPFNKLSRHSPLVTAQLEPGVNIDSQTTAHVTYLVPRSYGDRVVYEGRLDNQSVTRLNRLFHDKVAAKVPH